jgi:uncharacterized protein
LTAGRRAGMWRWLGAETGLERFELWREAEGWTMCGTILAVTGQGPVEARYEVACNTDWRTRSVFASLRQTGGGRAVRLAVDGGRWLVDGRHDPALDGCLDVDLSWSPLTNTLPIRRLALPVGQASGPLTMAWVRFPALTVEPLPQRYDRLAADRYRYSSRGGEFTAEIEVDAEGLVVKYQGAWERLG